MSVEALMTQPVTLRKPTGETRTAIGGSVPVYATIETLMYLQPTTGHEDAQDRGTPIGDWTGIGRADVDFGAWDQIMYGAHLFDIIAPPEPAHDPRAGVTSHVKVRLQEVT